MQSDRPDRWRRSGPWVDPRQAPVDPNRFFASIARERRLRRLFNETLAPHSPLLQQAPRSAGGPDAGVLQPLPGGERSSAGGYAAPPADDSDGGSSGPIYGIGLNSTKAWTLAWEDSTGSTRQPPMYGTDGGEPFDDCSRLGAHVLRQVGDRDLVWTALAPDDSSRAGFGQGQPVRLDTASQVLTDDNRTKLAAMLAAARDQNLQLVLTFLHLGAGGTEFQAAEVFDYGPDGTFPPSVDAWGDIDMDGTQDLELHRGPHCALPWADAHQGRSLALEEGGTAHFVDAPPTDPLFELHYAALEPGMTYKGQALSELAVSVVQLLDDAATAVGARLDEVVWAIEVFNEIDVRSVYFDGPDPAPHFTGQKWGSMCYRVARALRQALDERGWIDVRIMLPGLSSYNDGAAGESWEDKKDFVRGLVQGFLDQATEIGPLDGFNNIWEEFSHIVAAWDVHWYHRDASLKRSILYLGPELDELREAIYEGAVDAGVSEQYSRALSEEIVFTNFESGVSIEPHGSTAAPTEDWYPVGLLGQQQWQASEVWRRLGGALAGGAAIAGWHAWMSGRQGAFVGCGLRDEGGMSDEVDALFERGPEDSTQRLSWFAYERFATHVALFPITAATVAWPRVDTRADVDSYVARVESALAGDPSDADWASAAPALVLEFQTEHPLWPWTYVLMLDWTLFPATGTALALAHLRWVALSAYSTDLSRPSVTAWEFDGTPDLPSDSDPVTYSAGGLPLVDSPSYSGVVVTSGGLLLNWLLQDLRQPVVLRTRQRLSWYVRTIVPVSTGLTWSPVPAWLDDPRAAVPR